MRAFFKSPLFLALAIALLSLPTQLSQAFDHVYWNVWFKNAPKFEPDDVLIVSMDAGKPATATSVVSSTAMQAQLLRVLSKDNPSQIYFDIPVISGVDAEGDAALRAELVRDSDMVTLVNRGQIDPANNTSVLERSTFSAPRGVKQAASVWDVNFLGYAEHSTRQFAGSKTGLRQIVNLKDDGTADNSRRYPNFRLDTYAVPLVDARDIMAGKFAPSRIEHKTVFVTSTNPEIGSALGFFGRGTIPAAIVDISALHGKNGGSPVDLGPWLPAAILLFGAAIGRYLNQRRAKILAYGGTVSALLLLPGLLREINLVMAVGPALSGGLVYGTARAIQKWRSRMRLTNSASGLPNLEALAVAGIPRSQDVVCCAIAMYDQIMASLPRELHGECARQITRRLSIGAGDRTVYDSDGGHFVWLEDSRTLDALVEHLEGLKALFSAPLVIEGHVLDTNVHFGIDRNVDSRPMSRIQSALTGSNEAQNKGKLYEEFGQQRLAQSPWELSLHARIDEGLRNGDIWLALQPQYDFRAKRFSGAEALIRWSDPERGAIPPDAFILQAERAGRIEALTYWVLEKAIGMARELNRIAGPFQISVNLSARIVDHPALVRRVADIVRETEADCGLITFEVTETFSMSNREQAKQNLAALRSMGFRLSIDDFGTGQASLTYLSEIPSDEIKLDRRFVQAASRSQRDRQIVESVIDLAHALGQEVVAEGIEDVATLELLRRIGCDLAQGYYVGRPMKYAELYDQLDPSQSGAKLGPSTYV